MLISVSKSASFTKRTFVHPYQQFHQEMSTLCAFVMQLSSEDALFVVLELHNDRFDVLARILPLFDALLSVAVEVLLVLISQSLVLESSLLAFHEVLHSLLVLEVGLGLLEALKLAGSLALFLLLLLLCKMQLLVADLPELGEVLVLLDLSFPLVLLPRDLQLSASLDGGFHLSLASLLLLKEPVGTIFSLSNLPVQDLFLVVLQGLKLTDLTVDHALPRFLFVLEALLLTLFLHVLELLALESEGLNSLFFFDFLEALSFLDLHEILVSSGQV